MFMYCYYYVCSVLYILFHCVVLCTVYVYMCTVLLPPAVSTISFNQYIDININLHHCITQTVSTDERHISACISTNLTTCRFPCVSFQSLSVNIRLFTYIYRVEQEECARLREGVPYVKVYPYNPKHLYPKLNGLGDNGN